ncbi:hypothetical protein EIK77_002946 [Talaromyces pinophilus]|nr:hypothetical protein EIK77_002946 [Talaromyces pinophilus]
MSDQSGSWDRSHCLVRGSATTSSDEDEPLNTTGNAHEYGLRVVHSRSYPSKYTGKKIINQYAARCLGVEPPVIYQATILDASNNSGPDRGVEVVTYQDDRPFQFTTGAQNQTIQVDITHPDQSDEKYDNETLAPEPEDDPIIEWTGPVLEVNLIGRARFLYRNSRNVWARRIQRNIPKRTEDLFLEDVLKASIVLRSPHLLHALEGLIDYYPSFHTQLKAGDKKSSRSMSHSQW